MNLQSLSLINFKNYEQADIAFSPAVNCLLGDNGEGKTNVLDAIHILSFCKSYFNPIDSQSIKFDTDFYMVQGKFSSGQIEDDITCSVKRGRKKTFKRNQSQYDRLADHIGRYPVVMITPYDSDLILGGSEIRRKFMDSIISQYDRDYLQSLIGYNKTLDQRNAYLKQVPPNKDLDLSLIDALDQQLVAKGILVHKRRKTFIEDLILPVFQDLYSVLSDGKEKVSLLYQSQIAEDSYEAKLKESLGKDKLTQYTNVGVHKDDLIFGISDHQLKKFGSQGQQKTFLIALKLAYYRCIKEKLSLDPILLLDDIFDKLDKKRVMALLKLVMADSVGQTFITDTSADRIPDILSEMDQSFKTFHIKNGEVHEA